MRRDQLLLDMLYEETRRDEGREERLKPAQSPDLCLSKTASAAEDHDHQHLSLCTHRVATASIILHYFYFIHIHMPSSLFNAKVHLQLQLQCRRSDVLLQKFFLEILLPRVTCIAYFGFFPASGVRPFSVLHINASCYENSGHSVPQTCKIFTPDSPPIDWAVRFVPLRSEGRRTVLDSCRQTERTRRAHGVILNIASMWI
jgi:hypothetical protein